MYGILWMARGGDGTPLVLDLNAQYVYFFEALRNFVYGDGSLLYSFSRSLGGEFMGIYAYYMASPLTYIVALFPQDRMQEAVLCLLLLKTGLSGLSFGYYLHKRTRRPEKTAIFTFSLLYALTAFAVVHQNNTMWIDALIWLPLLAYGLEELVSKGKYKLYTISLAVILICNYYIGYMVCIFAILYFCYCYFSKSAQERNPQNKPLHFIRTGSRFAGFSLLSAGISAFMLIAAYYSLGFGKSDFSNPNWGKMAKFEILDFLSKFLPGSFDTVEPAGLPFVYCGLLALILLPVYFVAKKISTREKIASAALLAVFVISFFVNPLDLIWHGFSVPNWLNARYSFLFCFVILVLAYKGYGNLKRVGEKFLLGIGGALILLIAVLEKYEFESYINLDSYITLGSERIDGETLFKLGCIWVSVIFTVALIVLLCIKVRNGSEKTKKSISAIISAVVCAELIINGAVCLLWFNADVFFAKYSKYQNHLTELRPVVEQLEEYDDGFYRAEKTNHRTKNDNMALGLKGLTNSTSTLNSDAIEFTKFMGYTGRAHLTMYNGGTPLSDSLLGIKYVIDAKTSTRFSNVYRPVAEIESNEYNVYNNPYAMSLAYGVDEAMKEFDFSSEINYTTTYFNEYNKLLGSMLGKDSIEVFKPVSKTESSSQDCIETNNLNQVTFKTEENGTGIVAFSYRASYTGNYYFYSPVVSPKEISVSFNGSSEKIKYLGGDTNHILHAGYHQQGDVISVIITLPKDTSITFRKNLNFLWYLDEEIYESAMQTLLDGPQLTINESSEDHHITGSISTSKASQMIFTTIPYDEGWTVYVDGTEVEIYESVNALMSFDIDEAGEHEIEMKYFPDCYRWGIVISACSVMFFVAICAVDYLLKKTLLKDKIQSRPHEYWTLEDLDNNDD